MALKHIDTSKTGYKPKETPYQKLMREAQEAQAKQRATAYTAAASRQAIESEQAARLAEDEARRKALQQAQSTTKTNAYKQLQATPTSSGKPALVKPEVRRQAAQTADLQELRSQQNAFVPKTVQPETVVSKTADARRGVPDIRDIPAEVAQLTSGMAQQAGASLGVFTDTTARAGGWRPVNEIGQTDTKNTPAMRAYAEASKKIEQVANQYKGAPKVAIDVTTSMGRNLLTLAASAVNPAVGMSIMGAMAAGDKAYELRMQDISSNEALMRGLVSGIIEGATEAISFSKLANIAKTGGNGFIRNLAEQVFTEATEEAIAYTANYIADKAAKDPNAIFSVKDLAYSAALGGLAGGIMGGGATVVNKVANVANRPAPQQTPAPTLPRAIPANTATQTLTKPVEQVVSELKANPVTAVQDPTTAAAVIDPANVETIMSFMQQEYGDKAFEATQSLITAAKNITSTTTAQQATPQATNTPQAVQTPTQDNHPAESRYNALQYIRDSKLSDTQKSAFEKVVQNSKYNIRFDDTLADTIDGYNDGTEIVINPNSDKGIDYIITHEIGHYGENNEMIDYALQSLKEIGYTSASGDNVIMSDEAQKRALDNIKANYAKQGVQLDDTGAKAELAMMYYGELLKGDTKTIERLAKAKPNVIQRVIEAVDDLITRFKGTPQEKQLAEARKRFVDAVRGGTEQGQTKYSISIQTDSEGKQLTQEQADNQFEGKGYSYIAFSPEQIKSVDNLNPTSDKDIRYSTGNSLDDAFKDNTPADPRSDDPPTPVQPPDANIARTAKAAVLLRSAQEKITFKQSVTNTAKAVYREFTDVGASIEDIAKLSKDSLLYPLYNNAKQGRQAAEYMIAAAQHNAAGQRVGDSLIDILLPIMDKGDEYYTDFQTYLYNWHHIDRIADPENPTPVLGNDWTAQDAQQKINELAAKYSEFADLAKKVWKYSDNLLQLRVDTGLISQEKADELRAKYPHYVPTFRDMSSTKGMLKASPLVVISTGIKKATGSERPLLPLHENLARQTMQAVQAGKRNIFATRLFADAITARDSVGQYIQEATPSSEDFDFDADQATLPQLKNGLNLYVNGKMIQLKVSGDVYTALEDLTGNNDMLDRAAWKQLKEINKTYKKLITSLSPFFTVRNITRDLQDVLLYSKDLTAWTKALPQAVEQMSKNGELWRLYQSQGGFGSSFFDYQRGINFDKLTRKGFKKVIGKSADAIESLNFMVEQFPRFAEFVATINKGGRSYENIQRAMFNAADVTVNFGRHGRIGRVVNSTFVPFFNPAIQGFDKMVRTFTQQPSARQWTILALRAGFWGILPSVLNSLLVGLSDDEEMKKSYAELKDRDKDVNYLMYMGDGVWFKLPKGRVVSLFGAAAQRAMRTPSEGLDKAWAGYLDTAKEQVLPQNPFTNNIFSPLWGASVNLTWWGGNIEPERLTNLPDGERYDESTDYFSQWLGGILHYSPKKINYMLDSYTGIIGDIVLPLMTPRAEQNPFAKAFTIDSKLSNRISGDFYDKKTKLTQASNSSAKTPLEQEQTKVLLRYYNKMADSASELNKEIRAIENDRTKSDSEKRQEVRALKVAISAIQQKTLADVGKLEAAIKKRLTSLPADEKEADRAKDRAYLMANKEVFGAEYAIQTHSKDRYAKAQEAAMQGISYNTYFDLFFANTPDSDGNGSISQDEMRAALDKTALSKSQKAFLFTQQNKEWKNNPYK